MSAIIEYNNEQITVPVVDGKIKYTFTANSTLPPKLLRVEGCSGNTKLKNIQLEHGSNATTFVAPEITPGEPSGLIKEIKEKTTGVNLVYNGNESVTSASYLLKEYTLTEDLKAGETYTFVLKGSKLESQNFELRQNRGATNKGILKHLRDDLFSLTFAASGAVAGNERLLSIYQQNQNTLGPVNIEWVTLVSGMAPLTSYVASTQQILDDMNKRALDIDVRNIEDQVSGLNSEYLTLVKNYNALQKDQIDYQTFLSKVETVANSAASLANQVNNANAVLQTNLEKQAEKWITQEGFIQFDGNTNSMTITSESGGTQMIIDDEALRFFSGGEQVAVITNQYLQIDRGIFTMSAQIGRHKFAPLSSNNDHFILSYVN